MDVDDFRRYQREGASANLFSLVMSCRRRFLNAARLLEVNKKIIDDLSRFGIDQPVDLWPLLAPFTLLAERYIEHFFNPQDNLFHEQLERQDEQWSKYFYQILVPHILSNDEAVRNILRSVGALPCSLPEQTSAALKHYFSVTTLPETFPLWSPEDKLDY
jgi:hypothetical protein